MKKNIYPSTVVTNQPPTESIKYYGIDLGTTYSLFAMVDSSHINFQESNRIPVKFITINQESPNKYDSTISDEKVASILAIYKGKPFVGNNLYHLKGKPEFKFQHNMFYHWKVEMGIDQYPMYPEAVSEQLNMPYKIAGGILNYCRLKYLSDPAKSLGNTIITVPASFQANQRQDTIKAAKLARIETSERMLIDEPNAAFLGYFNRLEENKKQIWAEDVRDKNVLIVDFGGGTLDLSILNVDFRLDTGITIGNKAISRYNDLGGQDIDMLIAEEFLYPKFVEKYPSLEPSELRDLQLNILPQLSDVAERLKIALCEKLNLKAVDRDVKILELDEVLATVNDCNIVCNSTKYDIDSVSMSGAEFKKLFIKLFRGKSYNFRFRDKSVTTISQSITEIINKSNLTLDTIHFVLYVGGGSFNPFLISMVNEKLQNSKSLVSPEPDKLVAEGAAMYSYFLTRHGYSLISPITSDTIGVKVKGNVFIPIIKSGQLLPVTSEVSDFKLQNTFTDEIVVPVCINGTDFPIGKITCSIGDFTGTEDTVKIKATLTEDKIFKIDIFINNKPIGSGKFDNPFSIGAVTEEKLEILELQSKIHKAQQGNDTFEEKKSLRNLIWKQSEVDNYHGVVECAEKYIKKFDDQDAGVWNMIYIGNNSLGRKNAAKNGLERAIEIAPESSMLIYNYSLVLEKNDPKDALNYLLKQQDSVLEDETVRYKIILLKAECGQDSREDARKVVSLYKSKQSYFSEFDKRIMLPAVFKIVGEPYSYVDSRDNKEREDEEKFLDIPKTIITTN